MILPDKTMNEEAKKSLKRLEEDGSSDWFRVKDFVDSGEISRVVAIESLRRGCVNQMARHDFCGDYLLGIMDLMRIRYVAF